jgi:hypothetical protein
MPSVKQCNNRLIKYTQASCDVLSTLQVTLVRTVVHKDIANMSLATLLLLNVTAAATTPTAESCRLPQSVAVQAVLGSLTTDVSGHVSQWCVICLNGRYYW